MQAEGEGSGLPNGNGCVANENGCIDIDDIEGPIPIATCPFPTGAGDNKSFLVMHFGTYGRVNGRNRIPAEFALAEFNLGDGIIECYSQTIRTGPAFGGYESTVREAMAEHGYEHPKIGAEHPSDTFDACVIALEKIKQMMTKVRQQNDDNGLVTFYTLDPFNKETITDCIEWMCDLTGIDLVLRTDYRVKMLDKLFMKMIVEASPEEFKYTNRTHIREDCKRILKFSEYIHMRGIACEDHVKPGRPQEKTYKCSKSIVQSWTYNLLKRMTGFYQLELKEGGHYPKPQPVINVPRLNLVPVPRFGI